MDFANPKWRLAGGIWGGGEFLQCNDLLKADFGRSYYNDCDNAFQ